MVRRQGRHLPVAVVARLMRLVEAVASGQMDLKGGVAGTGAVQR